MNRVPAVAQSILYPCSGRQYSTNVLNSYSGACQKFHRGMLSSTAVVRFGEGLHQKMLTPYCPGVATGVSLVAWVLLPP
jgi:hypothetical protein